MSVDLAVLRDVQKGAGWAFCCWHPLYPIVVAGRGSVISKEVNEQTCRSDGVKIFRRRTGGGSVVLAPGMLVLSLAHKINKKKAPRHYVERINDMLILWLTILGVKGVSQKGISDLCINDRKILGSGMYLGKNVLFFQGSLLVNADISLFDRYLLHPAKEPDYRKGRKHRDFVITLKDAGYDLQIPEMITSLRDFLKVSL